MITGCNRGIGKAMLEAFAKEGADIIACTRKLDSEIEKEYQYLIDNYGIKVYPYTFDLSDEDSVSGVMKDIIKNHKIIDCLINNAGIPAGGLFIMTSQKKLKEVFQVNYFSQVLITQYVLKNMIKSHSGNVIFMNSVMGMDAMAGGTAYGASKAAIGMLVKSLSKEVGSLGIRVNAIAPNLVATDMANAMEEKSYNDMIGRTAMKRIGKVEEIANTALFLASDDASYITGQTIRVDGGL